VVSQLAWLMAEIVLERDRLYGICPKAQSRCMLYPKESKSWSAPYDSRFNKGVPRTEILKYNHSGQLVRLEFL